MRVLRANTFGGRISKLENKSIGITQFVKGKKNFFKEKNEQSKSVIHHQLYQHMYNRSPRVEKKICQKKIFEEVMAENFPHMGRKQTFRSRETRDLGINKSKKTHIKTY